MKSNYLLYKFGLFVWLTQERRSDGVVIKGGVVFGGWEVSTQRGSSSWTHHHNNNITNQLQNKEISILSFYFGVTFFWWYLVYMQVYA